MYLLQTAALGAWMERASSNGSKVEGENPKGTSKDRKQPSVPDIVREVADTHDEFTVSIIKDYARTRYPELTGRIRTNAWGQAVNRLSADGGYIEVAQERRGNLGNIYKKRRRVLTHFGLEKDDAEIG